MGSLAHHSFVNKKLFYASLLLLPLALYHLYFKQVSIFSTQQITSTIHIFNPSPSPSPPPPSPLQSPPPSPSPPPPSPSLSPPPPSPLQSPPPSPSPPPPPPLPPEHSRINNAHHQTPPPCDYADGEWVPNKQSPMYNGSSCETIKAGQNCMVYGRPDTGYLHWKWKPKTCNLSRFDPGTFLSLTKNKHIAFVGDSLARNQVESLICLLASASKPNLFYTDGEENKFRKWHIPSHNVNVSIYWSPFLVKGIEKNNEKNFNTMFLDNVNEKWASDLGHIDILVLSIGHWFLLPAIYHYGDVILGCHYQPNCTEIGFFDVFGKALNTTFRAIIERRHRRDFISKPMDVFFVTFPPAHFEGEWDKFGACSKTQPYNESDHKVLDGASAEMWRVGVEEVKRAKLKANVDSGGSVRFEALDISKLAMLRPDGHPGPYMNPFPFANGVSEHVQNDCVHWCLPGPIDTWNEILFDVIKRWSHGVVKGKKRDR